MALQDSLEGMGLLSGRDLSRGARTYWGAYHKHIFLVLQILPVEQVVGVVEGGCDG